MGDEQRSPENAHRLRELFARACRLDPDRRAAFLDETCAGDPGLRAAVESLLAHDRDASQVLGPLTAGDRARSAFVAPGSRLGDFELLRELGRGGMGIVYEARQVSLNRHVALKVLPPGLGLTVQAVQRFEREAKAAAKLHHTNIVSVHAIGEEEGCHYYAMELIEGRSLSQVLRDLSDRGSDPLLDSAVTRTVPTEAPGASEPPSPPTSSGPTSLSDTSSGRKWFDAVATLIAEVADALEYAHGRGVIHRDIKPANLMLSGDGRLCIADFGLARVAQEPGMTVSGSLLGTPAYMSPEQIAVGRAKLDHRTDIYSLGAVLYELLTQRRPFPGESREEVLSAILTKDPRPPRRLNPRIPVDLETICQKAMEKDPDRRYQAAGEFANDLRQYVQRGLILARRARLPRRVWKAMRRRPVAATATAAAIVAVLLLGWNWRIFLSWQQADVQRLISDARFHLVRGEIGVALQEANAVLARDPDNMEGLLIRSRVYLHLWRCWDAVRDARAVLRLEPENWEAHLMVAAAASKGDLYSISVDEHFAVVEDRIPNTADAYSLRGILAVASWDQARGTIPEGIAWLDKALEMDPGHGLALVARSDAYRSLKDYPKAMEDAERLIVALPRSALGYVQKSWISIELHDEEAALEFANKAIELDPATGDGYYVRARILWARGRRDDSADDLTRAIEVNPTERSYRDRADDYLARNEYDRAIADAEKCLEIDPDEAACYDYRFLGYWASGRTDEAVAVLRELDERAEQWVSTTGQVRRHTIWLEYFRKTGEFERALAEANRIVELVPRKIESYAIRGPVRQLLGGEKETREDCDLVAALEPELPGDVNTRAHVLQRLCNRNDAALAAYDAAIEIAPHWAAPRLGRGDLHRTEHRYEDALADFDKAIELAPSWLLARFNRGIVYFVIERFEEALADFERIKVQGAGGTTLTWYRAQALQRLGREREALEALEDCVTAHPADVLARLNQANMFFRLGRSGEAIAPLDEAIAVNPRNGGLYHVRAAVLMHQPGMCDRAMVDLAKAEELEPENAEIWSAVSLRHTELAYHLCPERYDPARALELARKAAEFNSRNAVFRGSFGLALYRNGAFEEARAALLESIGLAHRAEAGVLFFTAMACHELGLESEAAAYFERAVARMAETWPRSPDLLLAQKEAAELLGVEP